MYIDISDFNNYFITPEYGFVKSACNIMISRNKLISVIIVLKFKYFSRYIWVKLVYNGHPTLAKNKTLLAIMGRGLLYTCTGKQYSIYKTVGTFCPGLYIAVAFNASLTILTHISHTFVSCHLETHTSNTYTCVTCFFDHR